MDDRDIEKLAEEIYKIEKERINNAHWADLTYKEIDLIDDKEKRREYQQIIKKFHIQILNPLANCIPKKFKFSVPDELLTYRIVMNEYMQYFYNKGMNTKQIIKMIMKNKENVRKGKQK